MTDIAVLTLQSIVKRFESIKALGDGALAQLEPGDWHAAPHAECNSAAVTVRHLEGNMRSRFTGFLSTDGEKPGRDRDVEFEPNPAESPGALMRRWEQGWQLVFNALDELQPADLGRTVYVRDQPLTVVDALNRQLAHYGYHVGQLVLLAKWRRGAAWRTLSIARNASRAYRARPTD